MSIELTPFPLHHRCLARFIGDSRFGFLLSASRFGAIRRNWRLRRLATRAIRDSTNSGGPERQRCTRFGPPGPSPLSLPSGPYEPPDAPQDHSLGRAGPPAGPPARTLTGWAYRWPLMASDSDRSDGAKACGGPPARAVVSGAARIGGDRKPLSRARPPRRAARRRHHCIFFLYHFHTFLYTP